MTSLSSGTLLRMGLGGAVASGALAWQLGLWDSLFPPEGGQPKVPRRDVVHDPFYLPTRYVSPDARTHPKDFVARMAKDGKDWKVLDLRRTMFCRDFVLDAAAKHCPNLEELYCSDSLGLVSDDSLVAVAKSCPKLRVAEFYKSGERLTDLGILRFLHFAPNVDTLRFSNGLGDCSVASEAGLVKLASMYGNRMRHLDLSEEMPVTDKVLHALADGGCDDLVSLNITGSVDAANISDDGVLDVLQKCRNLEFMGIAMPMSKVTGKTPAYLVLEKEYGPSLKAFELTTQGSLGGAVEEDVVDDLRRLRPALKVYTTDGL